MAKPKSPLLSLGARGTIADTLTFQKRGRQHFARVKPIPKDPKSPAQLAWRQIYRDAVTAWHALSAEGKEAWRGVCPGLTAYQCFMRSELLVPTPPPPPEEYTEEQTEEAYNMGLYASASLRATQKLNVPNRTIIRLSLKGFRVGTPPGTAYYRIRKVSDDSIIAEVSFDPASWNLSPAEWHEYDFDTPVTVNEEVRIGAEYNLGVATDRISVRFATDVKPDELFSFYTAGWTDLSVRDFTYIYTYTLP